MRTLICFLVCALCAGATDTKELIEEQAAQIDHENEMKRRFADGDKNNDGFHSLDEIRDSILDHAAASLRHGFRDADKDLNGVVTQEEYLAFFANKTVADFTDADTNKDGKHSLEEQIAVYTSGDAFRKNVEAAEKSAADILKADDQNNDGQLSEAEFLGHGERLNQKIANEQAFHYVDRNEDGFHDEDEIKTEIMRVDGFSRRKNGHFIEMTVEKSFKEADTNGDGLISKEEHKKAWPNVKSPHFESTDTDGDGKLSLEEALSYQSEHVVKSEQRAAVVASETLTQADRNGDGKLSLSEKNYAMQIRHRDHTFKDGDSDGDGFHTKAEIEATLMQLNGYAPVVDGREGKNARLMYFLPQGFLDGFTGADTNKDEKVSQEEYLAYFKDKTIDDFHTSDTDGDGFHSLTELAEHIHHSKEHKKLHAHVEKEATDILKKADKDGDDRISATEFNTHIYKHSELR